MKQHFFSLPLPDFLMSVCMYVCFFYPFVPSFFPLSVILSVLSANLLIHADRGRERESLRMHVRVCLARHPWNEPGGRPAACADFSIHRLVAAGAQAGRQV
mmetsp:Transcript_41267/g.81399  ORF Transcript_41267/g.81399 Transcript_41267/m.81399 type:complete len:101 (-) Transcript_41267:876-1178(-)